MDAAGTDSGACCCRHRESAPGLPPGLDPLRPSSLVPRRADGEVAYLHGRIRNQLRWTPPPCDPQRRVQREVLGRALTRKPPHVHAPLCTESCSWLLNVRPKRVCSQNSDRQSHRRCEPAVDAGATHTACTVHSSSAEFGCDGCGCSFRASARQPGLAEMLTTRDACSGGAKHSRASSSNTGSRKEEGSEDTAGFGERITLE